MSEQINKVLATTAQGFSTGEQAQARANIGALAESASSQYMQTSGMSAYQTTADMTGYLPISATGDFFTGVTTDSNLTGNGKDSALGLSTSITLESSLATSTWQPTSLTMYRDDVETGDYNTAEMTVTGLRVTHYGDGTAMYLCSAVDITSDTGSRKAHLGGEGLKLTAGLPNTSFCDMYSTGASFYVTSSVSTAEPRGTMTYNQLVFSAKDAHNWNTDSTLDYTALKFKSNANSYIHTQVERSGLTTWFGNTSAEDNYKVVVEGRGAELSLRDMHTATLNYESLQFVREYLTAATATYSTDVASISGSTQTATMSTAGFRISDDEGISAFLGPNQIVFSDTGSTAALLRRDVDKIKQMNCYCLIVKPTTSPVYLSTADYPSAAAAMEQDALLTIVCHGDGPNCVYPVSNGSTASLANGSTTSIIYNASTESWEMI